MTLPHRKLLAGLFALSLLVRSLTALALDNPGFFDAFYYYHIALNMADGRGLTESVIWNYLDNPQSLPRPSNQYWMPLTNLTAWAGIASFGAAVGSWRAAQIPFVLLSALLPPFSAWLAWQGWQRRDWMIGAAFLTLFSGFYFHLWVVPDSFAPYSVVVAIALVGSWQALSSGKRRWWVVAGLGAGLSHLTRVDGIFLLAVAGILLTWQWARIHPRLTAHLIGQAASLVSGYLLVMAPWWVRNILAVGTAFPGGGTQTLWMRSYNEIFQYRPELTLERYLSWGIGPILGSKLESIVWCFLIMLGAIQFFMAPFVFAALRDGWSRPLFRPFMLYGLLLLLAMPLVFTFPAQKGSLLHSASALIPWMMAIVPVGIDKLVQRLAAIRRSWNAEQASRVMTWGFVGLSGVITLYLLATNLWLPPAANAVVPRWNDRTTLHEEVESYLASLVVPHNEPIFVGDPPSYYVTSGRPALVIPTDGPAMLTEAARDWDAEWLLLDQDNAIVYERQYEMSVTDLGWEPIATFTDPIGSEAILYRLKVEQGFAP